MKRRRFPSVFRVSAILLLTALIAGQWWQRQPAGTIAEKVQDRVQQAVHHVQASVGH